MELDTMELVEFEEIEVEFAVMLVVEFPGTDREPVVFAPVELELEVRVELVVIEVVLAGELVIMDVVEQVVVEFVVSIVDGPVVEFVVGAMDELVDRVVTGTELVLFVASIGRDVIGVVVGVEELPGLSAMTPTATMAMMITTTTTAAIIETALFSVFNGS